MKEKDDDLMTRPEACPHPAAVISCLPSSSPDGRAFSDYLYAKGLARATVSTYERSVEGLRSWMEREGIDVQDLSYQDLTAWIRSLGGEKKTRSLHLTAARRWLDWQVEIGRMVQNPAAGIVIRGTKRRLPHDLLTEARLGQLFKEYNTESGPEGAVRQRNRAMLGLLVYQALTTRELARLEVEDIHLEGGMVEVPGSRTSNGRTLYLEGSQVLGLHVYLAEARPRLLEETGKASNRLFVSAGAGAGLNNALSILVRELKEGYRWFENARQLRSSRIALWLKSYDLREVQYRAGHRYVSSTEKYRAADLDALHRSLTRFHPLG